jgi:hypothetical protein
VTTAPMKMAMSYTNKQQTLSIFNSGSSVSLECCWIQLGEMASCRADTVLPFYSSPMSVASFDLVDVCKDKAMST